MSAPFIAPFIARFSRAPFASGAAPPGGPTLTNDDGAVTAAHNAPAAPALANNTGEISAEAMQ